MAVIRCYLSGVLLFLVLSNSAALSAQTWFVDATVPQSGGGASWETAFKTIREGIDASSDGDTVLVAQGTYVENIQFNGKNIELRSTDPLDAEVVANTIIDGNRAGSVVSFAGTEDETCVLVGFTIQNGRASDGGGICGGTWASSAHATILNNTISGNSGYHGGGLAYCHGAIRSNTISNNSALGKWSGYGGGLYCCHGTIEDNHITGNSAYHGAALYDCGGAIRGNTISDNLADSSGVLYRCHGTIQNNTIYDNSARYGGGLSDCDGTIQNNTICRNSAERNGGGLTRCDGTIENNTIYGNTAEYGGGLYFCNGVIRNCIIWGNVATISRGQLFRSSKPTYSCIQNWSGEGEGSMALEPYFIDAANGDFHLRSWSPCVDAGDPASPFSNEPPPNGERVNMGAFGNTPDGASKSPDADADGLPDHWELHWFGHLGEDGAADTDHDRIPNATEYRYGWDPAMPAETLVQNRTKEKWYQSIQAALFECGDGDEIVAYPGVYDENICFAGKNVVLRSSEPSHAAIVASTIIDGGEMGPVVAFLGTEDESCALAGFTIRNGSSRVGGGICGSVGGGGTHATIENNAISGNSGSGLTSCHGIIQNNAISGNSGSGLAHCNGRIQNNTICDNSTEGDGGGLNDCDGTILGNTICGNSARYDGGGLNDCDGTIQNNTIYGNSAVEFGGGLCHCDGTVQNNTIYGNSAQNGGGLYGCDGAIENNTICGNSPGGLYACNGVIRNCIIWGNVTIGGGQLSWSSQPTYSCIQNRTGEGEGNMALEPYFIDAANGDFHLRSWSPCIDAGDPSSPFSNEPEPNGERVNMGVFGNTPEAASKSLDADADRLPDHWELHWFGHLGEDGAADTDGDRIPNAAEYRYAWDPATAAETLVQNLTKDRWYEGIQAALFECGDGDEIVVYPGIYQENICFGGKSVVLRSSEPSEEAVVASTIIDGGEMGPVVTFLGTENESCILAGLTIQNGRSGIYGGTWRSSTHATIENNAISGNSFSAVIRCDGLIQNNTITGNGGGLSACDGLIQNNTISGNSGAGLGGCDGTIQNNAISGNATKGNSGGLNDCDGLIQNNTISNNSARGDGGGLYGCDGTIQDNVISGNSAGGDGGGLYGCDGTIENNTISGNSASGRRPPLTCSGGGLAFCGGIIQNNTISGNSGGYGGGLAFCHGTVENNLISGNVAELYGGGLAYCNGTIQNNTITDNSSPWCGGGLIDCRATIRNCIIWGNTAACPATQIYKSSTPTYSCIQDWTEGGDRNISHAPRFVDAAAGDYHLQADSPCIDAGVNYYWFLWPQRDAEGNSRLVGDHVDMGCYEYGSSLDSDGDLLSDEDELAAKTDPNLEDTDGDGLRDGLEILRGSDPAAATPPGALRVPSDAPTIQACLFLALNGDEIIVSPGVYRENVRFLGPDVILRSADPENAEVVTSTVIDGGGEGPCMTLRGTESEACVIAGLTIRNGRASYGGGICGGTRDSRTHATVENNIITENCAVGQYWEGRGLGGGLAYCEGIIRNNAITGNAAERGGGLYWCDGTIQNNVISHNSGRGLYSCDGTIQGNTISENLGGGLMRCNGMIRNNIIAGNSTDESGGGLYYCDAKVENNVITGNSADGTGGGLYWCDGRIENNLITGNWAGWSGGGLAGCGGPILENTITGNSAGKDGGGLYLYRGRIENNTIAGNSAGGRGGGLAGCGEYSCSEGTIQSNLITGNYAQQGGGGIADWFGPILNNTIIGNWTDQEGGGLSACGGTIQDNTISGSSAKWGGGLVDCDGEIHGNDITGNSAFDSGGGLYDCDGPIQHNSITRNFAIMDGGGLYWCSAIISDNRIAGNSAGFGGGLCGCHGTIYNNAICRNSAGLFGGGLSDCDGTIRNCTVAYNSAKRGGGLDSCNGTIWNCIIWGNRAEQAPQIYASSDPMFCCIQGWAEGGVCNIAEDPLFVDPDGADDDPETYDDNDYRLSPDSPCIDAGDNSVLTPPGLDADDNLRVAFGGSSLKVDLGPYEYNSLPFAVSQIALDEGGVKLTWNSQPNDVYTIWSFENVRRWDYASGWTHEEAVESQGQFTSWTDYETGSSPKYYRVEMLLPPEPDED